MEFIIMFAIAMFAVVPFAAEGIRIYLSEQKKSYKFAVTPRFCETAIEIPQKQNSPGPKGRGFFFKYQITNNKNQIPIIIFYSRDLFTNLTTQQLNYLPTNPTHLLNNSPTELLNHSPHLAFQSEISNPQSAIRNPKSAVRNPQSEILQIRTPKSTIRSPNSAKIRIYSHFWPKNIYPPYVRDISNILLQ